MSQMGNYLPGGGIGFLETLTGNSGGAVGVDPANNINVVGTGTVTVTGNPGTNTLTIGIAGDVFPWTVVTATSATMGGNNGYIANNAGVVALALPATAGIGDIIYVTGINNATGWKITQASGQIIYFSTVNTTSGATGYLQSSATRDAVTIVCVIANTTWQVISSIGNITYV